MVKRKIDEQEFPPVQPRQSSRDSRSGRVPAVISSATRALRNKFREEVRARYPVDQAIIDFSNTVLRGPSGHDQMALCPFHDDTRPSMSVRPGDGYFCCHAASCNKRGDVFEFIMEATGMGFRDALFTAAEKAGVECPAEIREGNNGISPRQAGNQEPDSRKQVLLNPANLLESDFLPIFKGLRVPRPGQPFPVWNQSGKRATKPEIVTYRPDMVHIYRDVTETPVMAILRLRFNPKSESGTGGKPDRKMFIPVRVARLPDEAPLFIVDDRERRLGWIVKGATTSRHRKPVYGMEHAAKWFENHGKRILVVEGEKTCNAARRMISGHETAADWLVLSPMGGYNAGLKADWTQFMELAAQTGTGLSDVTFSVWPDADHGEKSPGGAEIDIQSGYVRDAVGAFAVAMRKQGLDPAQVNFTRAIPGTDRKRGWDLADAESEDWNADRVIRTLDEEGTVVSIDERFLEFEVGSVNHDAPELVGDEMELFGDGPEDIDHLVSSGPNEAIDASDRTNQVDIPESPLDNISLVDDLLDDPVENNAGISESQTAATSLFDKDDPIISIIGDGSKHVAGAEAGEVAEIAEPGEIIDENIIGEGGNDKYVSGLDIIENNTFFRALGYRSCTAYYISLHSNEIFEVPLSNIRKSIMISLAPLPFWQTYFGMVGSNGRMLIDWDDVMSAMVRAAYNSGFWNPAKQAGQGVRIDYGQVVLNTGDRLWIQSGHDEHGSIANFNEYEGEYTYTISDDCGMPDFDNAFQAGDKAPLAFLDLVRKIDWRDETANTSALSLFGWICVGPVCGVLPWRPHLWLDGRRASGKSWIIENIIQPALGDYMFWVKSNSTEPGLRHMLNACAKALVFDEAEDRMAAILKLARHSATPGNSVVAQGVSGGGGQKSYSIASTFLFASITPQLEASADKTRFARASLGSGHELDYFVKHLETPASDLLTPDFSRRMIARIVMRAKDIGKVQKLMVRGLTVLNIERRLADVWGTYAAGAWCLLEDGIPRDYTEALGWVEKTFHIRGEILESADEIEEDKDHDSLFRHLTAYELRCETIHLGVRTFNLGSIMRMAIYPNENEDEILDMNQARKRLADIGIRPGHEQRPAKVNEIVDCLLIHRNSPQISKILSDTPYAACYVDVIQQAGNVTKGPSIRFGGLGTSRTVIVPLKHFSVLEDEDENDNQGATGSG